MRVLLLGTLLASTLWGCAHTPGEMRIGPVTDAQGQFIVWPPVPEVPRYMYVGDLIGENNFHHPGETASRSASGFWNWLVGTADDVTPLGLQRPQSGTVDEEGRIYVTDSSRHGVYVFDNVRGELLLWNVAEPQVKFSSPAGIVLDEAGGAWVADAELGLVAHLNKDGAPLASIGKGQLKRPTGLARDPVNKWLYVADTNAHDVKVFDEAGRLIKTIGSHGEGEGKFNHPTHLAFSHGNLYVTDTMNNRIQIFDAEGRLLRKFGERGLFVGNLVRPKGIGVDDEGNIYVVESYYDHLLVFSKNGTLLLAIGGTGKEAGHFYLPAGVWVDRFNRVFVADMFNGRVAVFQFLGGS
ncbi:MAG: 6-bladed beta-propeller [Pseudomonadota bacterium]